MIGILIALQINTWNQNKINRNYEMTILKEVKDALELDKHVFLSNIPFFKKVERSFKQLIILKDNPADSFDSIQYHLDIAQRFGISTIINYSPVEAIKSEGLDKVSNPEIRKSPSTLYGYSLKSTEGMINEIVKEELFNRRKYFDSIFQTKTSLHENGFIIT